MAIEQAATSLGTVPAVALVGALGVGSQWLAWRLQLPAIVLMLVAGVLVGPVLGILDPAQEFGDMLPPLIALAVAVAMNGFAYWNSDKMVLKMYGARQVGRSEAPGLEVDQGGRGRDRDRP